MPDDEGPSPTESLEELERRWREEDSPRLLLKLAEEYRHRGRVEDAVELLEEGVERHAEYLAPRVALGRYRLELGRAAEAAPVLEAAVEQDPTQLVANKLLVRAYLELGQPEKARDRLEFYTLLNESDPAIEQLQREIDGREAEGGPEQAPPAVGGPPGGGAERAPEEEAVDAGEPASPSEAPAADPWLGEGLGHEPADDEASEPFPGLGGEGLRRRYLESLSREGIFVLPEPPSPARPVTVAAPAAPQPAVEGPAPPAPPGVPSPGEQAPAAAGEARATLTLGRLYLEQGHLREARRIFRRLLDEDPAASAAREGLEAVRRASDRPVAASDLLGDSPPSHPLRRKMNMLEAYLRRLRQGSLRG